MLKIEHSVLKIVHSVLKTLHDVLKILCMLQEVKVLLHQRDKGKAIISDITENTAHNSLKSIRRSIRWST